MKKVTAIFVLTVLSGIGCLSAAEKMSVKADFYVAADGNDGWSGTLPAANSKSSDGPFATLARARDAVRQLKDRSPSKNVPLRLSRSRISQTSL